jgi:maleamate amidohydrolase
VCGATTSGCVRASVVDSVQAGFPTFVVTDCCADRAAGPHEANLFDMTAKYADPCTAEEVVRHLAGRAGPSPAEPRRVPQKASYAPPREEPGPPRDLRTGP